MRKGKEKEPEDSPNESPGENMPPIPPDGSALVIGGKVSWYNPPSIGHFGIRARKESYELWLVSMIEKGVPPEERERLWSEEMKKLMRGFEEETAPDTQTGPEA